MDNNKPKTAVNFRTEHLNALPEELKEGGYFNIWRYEFVKDRWAKVPHSVSFPPDKGKSTDKGTFGTLRDASAAFNDTSFGTFDGMGIGIFDNIGAIDIDHCVDGNGQITPIAADVVRIMDTYTEISPSGTGLRLIFHPDGFQYDKSMYYINNQKKRIEVYLPGMTNKYVSVTGQVYLNKGIEHRALEVKKIIEKYMVKGDDTQSRQQNTVSMTLSDSELIEKASRASNGAKFSSLWNGNASGYSEQGQNEADLALCEILAFWTGRDPDRIDRLFRQSGLYRQKWERRDYREGTINKAINGCGNVYSPEPQGIRHYNSNNGAFGWDDGIGEQGSESGQPAAETEQRADKSLYDIFGDKATFVNANLINSMNQWGMTYYVNNLMGGDIEKFKHETKTGFKNFDNQLGGLYTGLYVIAAVSSLGKTSFTLQIGDQIAEAGQDVIIFSLEMSKLELASKSIVRWMAKKDLNEPLNSLHIRKGCLEIDGWNALDAATEYTEAVGDRLRIIAQELSCFDIYTALKAYINQTGSKPVVIIDYLQIIARDPWNEKKTTKEFVDSIISDLKRMTSEFGITIICISSINRTNYLQPVDFESLKESGNVEYSADVVLGMQLQCLDEELFCKEGKIKEKRDRVKEAKSETPRKIKLTVLKNRYGRLDADLNYNYYPAKDLFIEDTDFSDMEEYKSWRKKGAK